MKVLYHHRIGSKDGQYVHIQELQDAIRRLGHEVITVEPSQFTDREFGSDSGLVTSIRQSAPKFAHELLELGYAFLDYVRLRRIITATKPDCIYERYNLFTPSGVWAKRQFNLPMLAEVNAPLFEERSRFGGIALKRLARWSEKTVWANADYVLPVSSVLANRVREAGIDSSRIVVVPNGVNLSHFSPTIDGQQVRNRFSIQGRLVLGFVGFVREWHGLDRVVKIVAELGDRYDLHLLVVGHGPGCAVIEQQAQLLGIQSRVTITGIVARSEIGHHVAAFDIALQPNVVAYASPLKLFEYLAMGKATIAPDLPNIRETLTQGVNALLFTPEDDIALSNAVVRLCSDSELRTRLGQAARSLVLEKNLTWDNNASRILALFDLLLTR